MLHSDHNTFLSAIKSLHKVSLTFFSKEDGHDLTSTCAPMDYAPRQHFPNEPFRYHFWDYESDETPHTLSIPAEQIVSITLLEERFDPAEFMAWTPMWRYPRDWGPYS
jgi:hypothetical protein